MTETQITYDGSHGLLGEVPYSGAVIITASRPRRCGRASPRFAKQSTRRARDWIPGGSDRGVTVSLAWDEQLGTFAVR